MKGSAYMLYEQSSYNISLTNKNNFSSVNVVTFLQKLRDLVNERQISMLDAFIQTVESGNVPIYQHVHPPQYNQPVYYQPQPAVIVQPPNPVYPIYNNPQPSAPMPPSYCV